jgi:hypothetical protein
MKFSRKLIVRSGTYGTISVPKPVLDAWASVNPQSAVKLQI